MFLGSRPASGNRIGTATCPYNALRADVAHGKGRFTLPRIGDNTSKWMRTIAFVDPEAFPVPNPVRSPGSRLLIRNSSTFSPPSGSNRKPLCQPVQAQVRYADQGGVTCTRQLPDP